MPRREFVTPAMRAKAAENASIRAYRRWANYPAKSLNDPKYARLRRAYYLYFKRWRKEYDKFKRERHFPHSRRANLAVSHEFSQVLRRIEMARALSRLPTNVIRQISSMVNK
jgi:hypothetical protein